MASFSKTFDFNSYERRDYESVDEKSLSAISRKTTKK